MTAAAGASSATADGAAVNGAMPDAHAPLPKELAAYFESRGWRPFEFQLETWRAYLDGRGGLIHAPTGVGKTLAAWLGPVWEGLDERQAYPRTGQETGATKGKTTKRNAAEPIRVLWVTPMRALASDTVASLIEPIEFMRECARARGERPPLHWTIEKRTGDTPASLRKKQADRLPTALVTTPESLTLLLTYPNARERLSTLRCVVVDEWHELLGSKRGTQTELALARLRAWFGESNRLRTWGLSATLGNLDEARDALLGVPSARTRTGETPVPRPITVHGVLPKDVVVDTIVPADIERFPWAGHLGIKVLPQVVEAIERVETRGGGGATLLFTNTRSQSEIWFRRLMEARPEWLGQVAIHHGSLDKRVRAEVERLLDAGRLRCVVCTSSLDLGVDFSPVEQVIQLGSPKGVARLIQRAGRSGHRPGVASRIICAPTHALELAEFAAARDAVNQRWIESRTPLNRPMDVLAQHLVTIACGGGFVEDELFDEVRTAYSYRDLTRQQWSWVMDFVKRGGPALTAYPSFARVKEDVELQKSDGLGGAGVPPYPDQCNPKYVVASPAIARMHRLGVGTISSDTAMLVRFVGGGVIGSIEESFIARLVVGDRFVFAGRVLELVRVRDMTAHVRRARNKSGAVPRWNGGKMPLSSQLAHAVRRRLESARLGVYDTPEMAALKPILELQKRVSRLPSTSELLVEKLRTRDGRHLFMFPLEGRHVHEGLAPLLAYRLTKKSPASITASVTDYGLELLGGEELSLDADELRALLSTEHLTEDLLACLNTSQLARRAFRDIARVAGLIVPSYPGSPRPTRHVQASADMFYDVLSEFDTENLLLDQARREVIEQQLEYRRLLEYLNKAASLELVMVELDDLSPMGFPVWAERLRETHHSSEKWSERIAKAAMRLEEELRVTA